MKSLSLYLTSGSATYENHRVAPPEHAEGAEDRGTKRVAASKLPQTGKELRKAAVRDGVSEHSVRHLDTRHLHVEQRQQQRRRRESEYCRKPNQKSLRQSICSVLAWAGIREHC